MSVSVRLSNGICRPVNDVPVNMVLAKRVRYAPTLQPLNARDSSGEGGVVNCRWITSREEYEDTIRVLCLNYREPATGTVRRRQLSVLMVDAEEGGDVGMPKAVEKACVPAEGGGGDGDCGDGMADVMVAVAEGALAVLPGFAPEDGGEGEEETGGGEGERVGEKGAELKGVVLGRVVGDEWIRVRV